MRRGNGRRRVNAAAKRGVFCCDWRLEHEADAADLEAGLFHAIDGGLDGLGKLVEADVAGDLVDVDLRGAGAVEGAASRDLE